MIRLVLIGDVHGNWHSEFDAAALKMLQPDAAIFVGELFSDCALCTKDWPVEL